jgi:hypothetical protein
MKLSHLACILAPLAVMEGVKKSGVSQRNHIASISDFIDFDEDQKS